MEITLYAKNGVYNYFVYFVLRRDGGMPIYYQMRFSGFEGDQSVFKVTLKIPDRGLYFYYFYIVNEHKTVVLRKGNKGVCCEASRNDYTLLVYDKSYKTPDWVKGGIIYHIFVDRFKKGNDPEAVFVKNGVLKKWGQPVTVKDPDGVFRANDFYGGNFQGIIDKLDYLAGLNVSILYLSPIFKSASNHRYDTGDYMQLDELLGNEGKFKELIDRAAALGMGVMLDGVFNHTGADSLYFNKFGNYPEVGAYQSKQSKYYSWYSFDDFPDAYDCWWGVTVSPTVNKQNKDYRKLILGKDGVLEKYTKMGVRGWRLDVVDELDVDFVDGIRKTVKKADKNALIIGEVWEDASTKVSYSQRRPYFCGRQLDGVMNYPFKEAIYKYVLNNSLEEFKDSVMSIVENYPKQSLDACMNIIGTHDTWRALNMCAGVDVTGMTKEQRAETVFSDKTVRLAIARMKIAAAVEFFLPGIPSVYYGDEAGITGYDDPLNRKTMPWGNFNGELLGFYKNLTRVRGGWKNHFAGDFEFLSVGDFLIIQRTCKNKPIFLVINNSGRDQHFFMDRGAQELLSGQWFEAGERIMRDKQIFVLDR